MPSREASPAGPDRRLKSFPRFACYSACTGLLALATLMAGCPAKNNNPVSPRPLPPTNTYTPALTFTPTSTATQTPSSTVTATPTNTRTSTPTRTPTRTVTQTRTPTITDTPTITGTPTMTGTPTKTPPCSSTANFGQLTAGGNFGYINGYVYAALYSFPGGTITSFSVVAGYTSPGNVAMALYTDNGLGTAPASLLVQSNPYPAANTGTWQDLDIPNTTLPAGNYWLAVQIEPNVNLYGDFNSPIATYAYITQAFGAFPPAFTSGSTTGAYPFAMKANYCAGSVPTWTPTFTDTYTPSWTPTVTLTSTPSDTPTITPTPSSTPTLTPSLTPTFTCTITPSYTPSSTPTFTPTTTPSFTPTPSYTPCGAPATFGQTGQDSTGALTNFTSVYFSDFSPSSSGTLRRVWADLQAWNSSPATFQVAVYTVDGSGYPLTYMSMAQTVVSMTSASLQWIPFDMPPASLSSGTTYALCLWLKGTCCSAPSYGYLTGGTNFGGAQINGDLSTAPTGLGFNSNSLSIYAEYCP